MNLYKESTASCKKQAFKIIEIQANKAIQKDVFLG
jgi:hypothetical protein